MKKYGEIFIGEETASGFGWEARWYEGDEVVDSDNGDAKTYDAAVKAGQEWIKSKGGK